MSPIVVIGWIITVVIAIIGWIIAIAQTRKSHKLERELALQNRRYEAYSDFMRKLDDISKAVRHDPRMIFGITNDCLQGILAAKNEDERTAVLCNFNQRLIDFVKMSCEPLMIIRQEINPLRIIASNRIIVKLNELDSLIGDFNNAMQACLASINMRDINSMTEALTDFSHIERWNRFDSLNKEIIALMREEIGANDTK